jgi:hypothetical protein
MVTLTTQAFYDYSVIRTIPIYIEMPLQTTSLAGFWFAMAAKGAISVAEYLAETLDKYEAGIWHSTRSTSSTYSWPDKIYPTRDYDVEQTYDYDPFKRTTKWWRKETWTTIDGTNVTTTVAYSSTPPVVVLFNQEDCHYNRTSPIGSYSSSWLYDSYETLTGYCIRRGSGAWGRPVAAWFHGWEWQMLVKNDIIYPMTVEPWEDNHYTFIGPSSLGTSSLALFKLKSHKYQPGGAEVSSLGVVTIWCSPDGTGF